ncbi:hypothetical protein TRFO_32722 [Tritrichomonas foetus]|uniref:Histidine acid phosphatase n=1 Tax=Tritrichomonas foetus TaxID=1144522 RepID=A0A1J4JSX4_9EUKA|nr:hypothetical protein TRFO_32722 [Tritrichomonas foetus]|eukprot:OHT00604.1 hypothetical protein TRFO_32722 [Tritrichomonas foetus]
MCLSNLMKKFDLSNLMILFFLFLSSFAHQFDFCNSEYEADPIPEGYNLIHTTIIFKHGHHAPVDKIPEAEVTWNCTSDNWLFPGGNALNDELQFSKKFRIKPISYQSFLLGNCRAGELLETGMKQMSKLAEFLKKTYSNIIPDHFKKRALSFRSTYTNRCLTCIQILAHHLFPGDEPIDVFVANEELESLVPNSYLCPSLGALYDEQTNKNSSFSKHLKQYDDQLSLIKNESNFSAVPHWVRMAEYLVTTKCANISYPGAFNDKFLNESADLLMTFFNHSINNDNGKKYASGILMSEIYLGMRDYLSGKSDTQFVLICGHTLTFTSLLSALNKTLTWQSYGAYMAFDLLQKNDELLIRTVLNGKTIANFMFSDFENIVMNLRPTEEECKIKYPFMEKDKKSLATKFLAMSFS